TVHAIRDKGERTFEVSLGELAAVGAAARESENRGPEASPSGTAAPSIGIDAKNAASGGAEVISVKPGSPAEDHLMPGDVIVEVNHAPVRTTNDLSAAVKASQPTQPLLLRVQRKGQSLFVAIEPHG